MATPKNHDLCIAAKKVILDNAAGIRARDVAAALGVSEFYLYELANPDSTRHLWITDMISLFLCGGRDDRLFQETCRKVGGVFVDLKRYESRRADVELASALKEAADFFSKAAECLEDGTITAKEKRGLREEGREAISAILSFLYGQGVAD